MTTLTLDDLTIDAPEPGPADWNDDGVVYLPRFVPDDLIDAYEEAWLEAHGQPIEIAEEERPLGYTVDVEKAGGWADATPYMRIPALRDLVTWGPLAAELEKLLGEPAGVHLNLTGWVSTQRDWHADTYLNPPHVGDSYAAIWVALEDVTPESGPFQYVPGSHRWPVITQELILGALHEPVPTGFDGQWPKRSERILTPLFEEEIERRDANVVDYLPDRGDVLIWHARLLHRGSAPLDPEAERRALIAHFSGIHHREDMPEAVQHKGAGWLFPIQGTTLV